MSAAEREATAESWAAEPVPGGDRAPYRLTVLDGVHAGAALDADAGVLSVGDDVSADFFLTDLNGSVLQLALGRGAARVGDAPPVAAPGVVSVGPVSLELAYFGPAVPEDDPAEAEAEAAPDTADALTEAWPESRPEAGEAEAEPAEARGAVPPIAVVGASLAGLAVVAALLVGVVAPDVTSALRDGPARAAVALAAAAEGPDAARTQSHGALAALADPADPLLRQAAEGLEVAGAGPSGVRLRGHVGDDVLAAVTAAAEDRFGPGVVDVSEVTTPARVEAALRRRLSESGAGRGLAVSRAVGADGQTVLTVSGGLGSDAYGFWGDVQTWFDRRFAGRARLEASVRDMGADAVGPPRVALEAVWTGRDPYIVTADGRRTRPGETLPNGWRLASVTQQEVRLERGGRIEVIALPSAEESAP